MPPKPLEPRPRAQGGVPVINYEQSLTSCREQCLKNGPIRQARVARVLILLRPSRERPTSRAMPLGVHPVSPAPARTACVATHTAIHTPI